MRVVSAEEAVRHIPDHSRVVVHQGCADPSVLWEALAARADRMRGIRLYVGFHLGDTGPLQRCLAAGWKAATWFVTPRLRPLLRAGHMDYLPVRYRELPGLFARHGPLPADVVLLQVTPPDASGRVSLGVSVGPYQDIAREAQLVIAEVNDQMPPTRGNSRLAVEDITLAVRVSHPLVPYQGPEPDAVARRIAAHLLALIPDQAWIQVGIGQVPSPRSRDPLRVCGHRPEHPCTEAS